jgi:hypothetical protein
MTACSRGRTPECTVLGENCQGLGAVDAGRFGLAAPTFQEEEGDGDKVTNGFYTFVKEERRRKHRRVLAIDPVVLVRANETSDRQCLRQWAKQLQKGGVDSSQWFGMGSRRVQHL